MGQENLTFAGVHDSFWTHARDVPKMSKIIREEFVKLHEQDWLQKLYDECLKIKGKRQFFSNSDDFSGDSSENSYDDYSESSGNSDSAEVLGDDKKPEFEFKAGPPPQKGTLNLEDVK